MPHRLLAGLLGAVFLATAGLAGLVLLTFLVVLAVFGALVVGLAGTVMAAMVAYGEAARMAGALARTLRRARALVAGLPGRWPDRRRPRRGAVCWIHLGL